jgi:hypothetical protein
MGEGVKSLRVCLARRRSGKAGRARWIGHRTEWMESRKVVAAGNCYGTAAPARQRKGFRSLILKRGRGGGSNRPGREGGGAAWTGVKGWVCAVRAWRGPVLPWRGFAPAFSDRFADCPFSVQSFSLGFVANGEISRFYSFHI